jgi:hypothetical protein
MLKISLKKSVLIKKFAFTFFGTEKMLITGDGFFQGLVTRQKNPAHRVLNHFAQGVHLGVHSGRATAPGFDPSVNKTV